MTFTLTLDCDNAAFGDGNHAAEVARILREIAGKLDAGHADGSSFDYNGNKVGAFAFAGDPPTASGLICPGCDTALDPDRHGNGYCRPCDRDVEAE